VGRLDDSTGERLLNAVHPEDRESFSSLLDGAIEKIEKCTFEVRWGSSDSFRWAMGEIVPELISEEVVSRLGDF
jgi:hypothetical protein